MKTANTTAEIIMINTAARLAAARTTGARHIAIYNATRAILGNLYRPGFGEVRPLLAFLQAEQVKTIQEGK